MQTSTALIDPGLPCPTKPPFGNRATELSSQSTTTAVELLLCVALGDLHCIDILSSWNLFGGISFLSGYRTPGRSLAPSLNAILDTSSETAPLQPIFSGPVLRVSQPDPTLGHVAIPVSPLDEGVSRFPSSVRLQETMDTSGDGPRSYQVEKVDIPRLDKEKVNHGICSVAQLFLQSSGACKHLREV